MGSVLHSLHRIVSCDVCSLAQAVEKSGGALLLTISIGYLQHFDIEAIQKHVDFFNM